MTVAVLERWRAGKSPILGPAAVQAADSRQGLNQRVRGVFAGASTVHVHDTLMAYAVGVFFEMVHGWGLRTRPSRSTAERSWWNPDQPLPGSVQPHPGRC